MNEIKQKTSAGDIIQKFGALITLVLLVIVLSIIDKDFRSVSNLMSLLRQASVNGLIAFGMTCVILTGGIDLSVGSTVALSSLVCALMVKAGVSPILAILAALALGTLLGATSGLLVTKGRLQPFIATLITMTVYRGLTLILSGGRPVSGLFAAGDTSVGSAILNGIGRGEPLGIPIPAIIFFVVFGIFLFILNKTVTGRRIYAVGSNEQAARLAGVNNNRTKLLVYSISGFLAAFAGLIILSRLGSAQPTAGAGYELDAIAAVALGGTSMSGGRGKLYGTLIGVLIIAVLSNGLNILNVSSYYQDVVKGVVILLAVLSDRKR
ncbi:MAG: ribose ABC transporter permease [Oscillospiraceae bacterium]